jgi:hypothetical protein
MPLDVPKSLPVDDVRPGIHHYGEQMLLDLGEIVESDLAEDAQQSCSLEQAVHRAPIRYKPRSVRLLAEFATPSPLAGHLSRVVRA